MQGIKKLLLNPHHTIRFYLTNQVLNCNMFYDPSELDGEQGTLRYVVLTMLIKDIGSV